MFDVENDWGETPAHHAAESGDVQTVRLLYSTSQHFFWHRTKKGDSIAHVAAHEGRLEVLHV